MIKPERSNLQSFCRTCLDQLSTAEVSKYNLRETPNLTKLLIICTELDIQNDVDEQDAVYPQCLCTKCHRTLQDIQQFRTQAHDTAQKLKDIVNNVNIVVKEEFEPADDPLADTEESLPRISDSFSLCSEKSHDGLLATSTEIKIEATLSDDEPTNQSNAHYINAEETAQTSSDAKRKRKALESGYGPAKRSETDQEFVLLYWIEQKSMSIKQRTGRLKTMCQVGKTYKIPFGSDKNPKKYFAKIVEIHKNKKYLEELMYSMETDDILKGNDDSSLATATKKAIKYKRKMIVEETEVTKEESLQDTIQTCSCITCGLLRSAVSVESIALLDAIKMISQAIISPTLNLQEDSLNSSKMDTVKPRVAYKIPGKDKVALVKNHNVYINIDDRQSAYIAAGGSGASLIRELLLRLVPLHILRTKTARGSGDSGISPELLDTVGLCANDLIDRGNEKQSDPSKQQKNLGRQEITKIVNTFLTGLRAGYHASLLRKDQITENSSEN